MIAVICTKENSPIRTIAEIRQPMMAMILARIDRFRIEIPENVMLCPRGRPPTSVRKLTEVFWYTVFLYVEAKW